MLFAGFRKNSRGSVAPAFAIALIPVFGMFGAAISTVVGYLMLTLLTGWQSQRHYPVLGKYGLKRRKRQGKPLRVLCERIVDPALFADQWRQVFLPEAARSDSVEGNDYFSFCSQHVTARVGPDGLHNV